MSMSELDRLIDAEVRGRVELAMAAQGRQLEAAQRRANDAEQENRVLRWALGGLWQKAMRFSMRLPWEEFERHRNDLVVEATRHAVHEFVRAAELQFKAHDELAEYKRRYGPLGNSPIFPPGVLFRAPSC